MEENNQIKIITTLIAVIIAVVAIIIVAIVIITIINENRVDNVKILSNAESLYKVNDESNIYNENKENNVNNKNNANNKNEKIEENHIAQAEYKHTDTNANYVDTDFSFKFLKMENKKENMIYSPISIRYALQMLNDGANGNTKAQIENAIGNTEIKKYENINNVLSLANALYIRDTYSEYVKDEYKNKLLNNYNAEIKYDNFESAYNINNWIENKTFGQIKNMLTDEDITNTNNEMILINALAIDMEWKEKIFGHTHGGTFYLEDGNEMIATMMNGETKSDSFSYYKDNEVTAVSMDLKQYENEQMEFIAIMPNENLQNYIENFEIDTLGNITSSLKPASETDSDLDITIPKFSFDYDLALENDLKTLGITDTFSSDLADFSNMSSESSLYVSKALHKANINFTEKGVKAAASTFIGMAKGENIAYENEVEIKIDKPFMYIIKDKNSDEIWFVGTVYKPNSWEKD